jgi:alkylation response protein AidB-like acyl-CoA dehydrogenase
MATTQEEATRAAELVARAEKLVPLVMERADAAEAQTKVTDDVIEAFHEEDLIGMWTPRSLGGSETGPVTGGRIIEVLSYADPSTGWIEFVLSLITATTGAYLGDEAVAEMYGGDRIPLVSGHGTRPGVAIPKDGGYLLSGNWSFGSGLKHASWTHSLGIVEGADEPRIFTGRVADAKLDWDSWDTLGLRATGSIDYSMDSVFIPESFTHAALANSSPRGGPLYKLGIIGLVCVGHGAWVLGTARRMLDDLEGLAVAKAGRPGAQAASDSFVEKLGEAEAKLRSARAFYYETWNDIEETLDRGDDPTQTQHSLMRLALNNATWSCMDVGNWVFDASSSIALRPGTMQRHFRDLKTGAQHITSSRLPLQSAGRMLAGLAEGQKWLFLELGDA